MKFPRFQRPSSVSSKQPFAVSGNEALCFVFRFEGSAVGVGGVSWEGSKGGRGGEGPTWDFVSTSLRQVPFPVFHRQILRSAVPPPEASTLCRKGHHAKALTAAQCRSMERRGVRLTLASHRLSRLSLPPEASWPPCGDHWRPQTSCWCPSKTAVLWFSARVSWLMIIESLDPLLSSEVDPHASEATLERCPFILLISVLDETSHS